MYFGFDTFDFGLQPKWNEDNKVIHTGSHQPKVMAAIGMQGEGEHQSAKHSNGCNAQHSTR